MSTAVSACVTFAPVVSLRLSTDCPDHVCSEIEDFKANDEDVVKHKRTLRFQRSRIGLPAPPQINPAEVTQAIRQRLSQMRPSSLENLTQLVYAYVQSGRKEVPAARASSTRDLAATLSTRLVGFLAHCLHSALGEAHLKNSCAGLWIPLT
eukprot:3336261-Amphidinium_carterae.1